LQSVKQLLMMDFILFLRQFRRKKPIYGRLNPDLKKLTCPYQRNTIQQR
jgi:hypothetical protein